MMRGDGRVFKRGQSFWIAYYKRTAGRSVEVREPGGKTEKDALKKLKHRRREMAAEALGVYVSAGPEADRLTIEDLLRSVEDQYRIEGKELKRSHSHMKPLRAFFGYHQAIGVTASLVQRYIKARQSDHAANGTINRELHILQRAFSLAVEQKRVSKFHVPRCPSLTEDNVREGFVEKADFDRVLLNLRDPDVQDFARWAFWSGMRRGEIAKLTWAAYDRESSTLILPGRSTKNKRSRKLVLEGMYREMIARRFSARHLDSPCIFHRQGKPIGSFRKAWKSACAKAGVVGLLFHDLRRTAVRNLIRAGIDTAVAKKISGHRTDQVFQRYNITSDEDIQDAQVRLEQYLSTLPQKANLTVL